MNGKDRIDQIVGHLSLEMLVVYGGNFLKRFHFISRTGQSASQLVSQPAIHPSICPPTPEASTLSCSLFQSVAGCLAVNRKRIQQTFRCPTRNGKAKKLVCEQKSREEEDELDIPRGYLNLLQEEREMEKKSNFNSAASAIGVSWVWVAIQLETN